MAGISATPVGKTVIARQGGVVLQPSGYLPGLDGLRAVAVIGVLMTHDLPWSFAGHSNAAWKGLGGFGVNLFFAISGVLIVGRLLQDEAKLGQLRLRSFYARRLCRIQPAAFAFLAAIAVLGLTRALPHNWGYWWSAVFAYTNFLVTVRTPPGAAAFVGHFWTLSVEEHFYLLISFFLLVVRRQRIPILAFLLGVVLAFQYIARHLGHVTPELSGRRTYWTIQYLLFPAFLALLLRESRVRQYAGRFLQPWVATLVVILWLWVGLLGTSVHLFREQLHHFALLTFLSYTSGSLCYGFALWVVAIMLHPKSWTTRCFEFSALRFVGRLSYSLYLWHVLFFMPVYLPSQIGSPWLLLLAQRPWKYVASFVVALTSYYLVEKPFIRLGHRIAPPATAGHADLAPPRALTEQHPPEAGSLPLM